MKAWFILAVVVLSACNKEDLQVPLTYDQQLALDIKTIDDYLATKGITNVVIHPSGLRYVIHTLGTGPVNTDPKSKLKVEYIMKVIPNDLIIDQSAKPPEYFHFPVSALIMGWQHAFTELPLGTSATLYIPSGLAYGTYAVGPIPPNSNLVFDIKFLDFYSDLIYDADGFEYTTVLVNGTRVWMAQNLRSLHYEDGDAIDPTEFSFYNDEFGLLYSFAAATHPSKICPDGYRLPTPDEFIMHTDLLASLGLGGMRDAAGNYSEIFNTGFYWTSENIEGTNNAVAITLTSSGALVSANMDKDSQLSVRCIRGN